MTFFPVPSMNMLSIIGTTGSAMVDVMVTTSAPVFRNSGILPASVNFCSSINGKRPYSETRLLMKPVVLVTSRGVPDKIIMPMGSPVDDIDINALYSSELHRGVSSYLSARIYDGERFGMCMHSIEKVPERLCLDV